MLSNNVAKIRREQGLNQRQLAEAIHVAQSLVCSVERSSRTPWPALIKKLEEVLNVKDIELFPHLKKNS